MLDRQIRSLSIVTSRAKMALKWGSSKHGKHERASVAANCEKNWDEFGKTYSNLFVVKI